MSYCKSCKKNTNHEVLQTENKCEMIDEVPEHPEQSEYRDTCHQIVKCNGCENLSFRIFSSTIVMQIIQMLKYIRNVLNMIIIQRTQKRFLGN